MKKQWQDRLVDTTVCALAGIVPLYILLCTASSIWLALRVDQAPLDFTDSSWLIAPIYFVFPMLSPIMGGLILALGCLFSFSSQRLIPLAMVVIAAPIFFFASPGSTLFKIGIADGWIKVGCYDYLSEACQTYILREKGDRPLIGISQKKSEGPFGNVPNDLKGQFNSSTILPLPGIGYLKSPFYVLRAAEINAKLEAQRAELAVAREHVTSVTVPESTRVDAER